MSDDSYTFFCRLKLMGYEVVAEGLSAGKLGSYYLSLKHDHPPNGLPHEVWGLGVDKMGAIKALHRRARETMGDLPVSN